MVAPIWSYSKRWRGTRNTPGAAGLELLNAVLNGISMLGEFPSIGRAYLQGTRRLLLPGFPLALVYEVDAATVVIVALEDMRREPGYWMDR